MVADFESIRILDNYYQTSSFFPMPVVLISTVSESGQTNLGPYSLCFPFVIADQGKFSMMLASRSDSNTALNIKRTGLCAINFIPDEKKLLEGCMTLGYPGETTEEKMMNSIFTLAPSMRENGHPSVRYPEIVEEAVQVFECTWDRNYDHKLCEEGDNFVLRVDNILLKKKYKDAIVRGMDAKSFPGLPIDYGFRDNMFFWFMKSSKPYSMKMAEGKGTTWNTVWYAAKRYDPSVEWTEDACAKLVRVPRIFLKRAIAGCVEAAKEEGIQLITPEFLDKIQDKRRNEKGE
ncbi:MAG: hypothetical protein ACW975_07790 [Candidatus Thorarchaeota archaeon]|jgi:flavin reductase (DIM6/NTAB) family NADH-FMN oxidoreductase RutF